MTKKSSGGLPSGVQKVSKLERLPRYITAQRKQSPLSIQIIYFILLAYVLFSLCTKIAISFAENKVVVPNIISDTEVLTETHILRNNETVPEMIARVSLENNANTETLLKVAFCESSYNPQAVGDGGKAKNIFQFHKPTFDEFAEKYGEDLNYNSAYDQAKLASKMIRDGKGKHWTCYKKL